MSPNEMRELAARLAELAYHASLGPTKGTPTSKLLSDIDESLTREIKTLQRLADQEDARAEAEALGVER